MQFRFAVLFGAPVLLIGACTGNDAAPVSTTIIITPEAGAPNDGGGGSANEAGTDTHSGTTVPGGTLLRELVFDYGAGLEPNPPSIAAVAGGGVVVATRCHVPIVIGTTTIPCSNGEALMKLDAELSQVEWYVVSANAQSGQITTSPSGKVFWSTIADVESANGSVVYTGNKIARTEFPLVGGIDGTSRGGARVVMAFNPDGELRWAQSLSQVDITAGSRISPVSSFGASEGYVVQTMDRALGTLKYEGAGTPGQQQVETEKAVIQILNADDGKTVVLDLQNTSGSHSTFKSMDGVVSDGRDRFVVARQQNNQEIVSFATFNVSGFDPTNDLIATLEATSALGIMAVARHGAAGFAYANPTKPFTLGNVKTQAGPSSDAIVAAIANNASEPVALRKLSGAGEEVVRSVAEVGASVYLGGIYVSTDFKIDEEPLPPAVVMKEWGVFLAKGGLEQDKIPIAWKKGWVSKGAMRMSPRSVTADRVSQALYAAILVDPEADVTFQSRIVTPVNQRRAVLLKLSP